MNKFFLLGLALLLSSCYRQAYQNCMSVQSRLQLQQPTLSSRNAATATSITTLQGRNQALMKQIKEKEVENKNLQELNSEF